MDFRNLRQELLMVTNTIDLLGSSRELSLAKTNSQQATMWCGTFMKFSKKGDNPYAKQDGQRETVKDIEPLFDATTQTLDIGGNNIKNIDTVRQFLGLRIEELTTFLNDPQSDENLELTESEETQSGFSVFSLYQNMSQVRMWLGMELGRIRDTQ